MSSISQPSPLSNDQGVIVTIGVVSEAERSAVVFPLASDSNSLNVYNRCSDAVAAVLGTLLADFIACLSVDAYVSFVQAEGMVDGMVPSRTDFTPTDEAGTRTGHCNSNQIALLLIFYEDPADVIAPERLRVGKNFISGLSVNDFTTGSIAPALVAAGQTLADQLQNGFPSVADPSSNWYRVLAALKDRSSGGNLRRTTAQTCRGYTGTQRRRLLPH